MNDYFEDDELIELFDRYFEKMEFDEDEVDNCIREFDEMNDEERQEFIMHIMVTLNIYITMIPTGVVLN
tara:strand:+ start:356 stop:562 length:207 start_codon:yes stop_codon:yes gene_type:complete